MPNTWMVKIRWSLWILLSSILFDAMKSYLGSIAKTMGLNWPPFEFQMRLEFIVRYNLGIFLRNVIIQHLSTSLRLQSMLSMWRLQLYTNYVSWFTSVSIVNHSGEKAICYLLSFFDPARPMWAQWAPNRQGVASDFFWLWAFLSVVCKIKQKITMLSFFSFSVFLHDAKIWRHTRGPLDPFASIATSQP